MRIILLILSCICINYANAQTIIDFDASELDLNTQSYYMKDINNYLNQFEGTWKYVSGNNEIELVFKKKTFTNLNLSGTIMEDALVGEYRYVKNGIEVLNTLQNINANHTSSLKYNIYNWYRINNQRLLLYYNETTLDNECIYGSVLIHTFVENGQTKLFFSIRKRTNGFSCVKKSNDTQPATDYDLELANGEYIFVKVP